MTSGREQASAAFRLLRDIARRLRRRARSRLLLPLVPFALTAATLVLLGALPAFPGIVSLAGLGGLGLLALRVPDQTLEAAHRIDGALRAKERFLTLATVDRDRERSPLLAVVDEQASRLARGADPSGFLPRPSVRPLLASSAVALALALAVLFFPRAGGRPPEPFGRLESLATGMERSGDTAGAAAVRDALEILRDPGRTAAEKRAAAAEAMRELERREAGDEQDGNGGEGESGGGESGAGGAGSSLREEAREELGKATGTGGQGEGSGETGGGPDTPPGGEEREPGEAGGGVDAPRPEGAGERRGESEGNRPAGDDGKPAAPDPGSAGPGDYGTGEPRPDRPGGEGPGDRDRRGASDGHRADRPGREGERRGEGEGPGGALGTLVPGGFVRVRIPDDSPARETERVRGPGTVELETPARNAPAPEAGDPDEVEARQPVPLEYRNALEGR